MREAKLAQKFPEIFQFPARGVLGHKCFELREVSDDVSVPRTWLMGRGHASFPLLLLLISTALAGNEYPAQPGESVAPNQFLVRYKTQASLTDVSASAVPGSQIAQLPHIPYVYLITVPAGTASSYSTQLSQNPLVEYVEPNRIRHATLQAPNDFLFSSQWDLQTVQAQQAWQILPNLFLTAASPTIGRIKVAVIDSGADCTQPDFINSGGTSQDAAAGGQIFFSASKLL